MKAESDHCKGKLPPLFPESIHCNIYHNFSVIALSNKKKIIFHKKGSKHAPVVIRFCKEFKENSSNAIGTKNCNYK